MLKKLFQNVYILLEFVRPYDLDWNYIQYNMSMAVNIGFINYYFNKVFIKVYIIGFLADKNHYNIGLYSSISQSSYCKWIITKFNNWIKYRMEICFTHVLALLVNDQIHVNLQKLVAISAKLTWQTRKKSYLGSNSSSSSSRLVPGHFWLSLQPMWPISMSERIVPFKFIGVETTQLNW